jgi:metallo-beta-lactamase family protein
LFGHYYPVRAKVSSIALSAHADQSDLTDWVQTATPPADMIYVNHGEPDSSAALIDVLTTQFGLNAVAPRPGERVRLDPRPWARAETR